MAPSPKPASKRRRYPRALNHNAPLDQHKHLYMKSLPSPVLGEGSGVRGFRKIRIQSVWLQ